jgi:hypothetical protein
MGNISQRFYLKDNRVGFQGEKSVLDDSLSCISLTPIEASSRENIL